MHPPPMARAIWSRPYVLLALASVGWGGNTVAGRLAVGQISPMAVVTLRWLITVLVLAVVVRGTSRLDWRTLAARWRYLLAMGGLGFTAFNAFFYLAAHATTAVNMGVVQGVTPGLVIAGSFLAYGTPIRAVQVVGIAVSVVGVAVMASRGDLEVLRHLAFNLGDLAIFGSSLLYAGYTVGLRDRPAVAPLAFFAGLALAAFATSLPLLAWEVASGTIIWPGPFGWALILYIAIIPSLVCQLLFMRSVELIGPSRAGLFMNLIPITAAAMGVALLGEPFGLYHAVALVCVIGGIWLAEQKAGPRPA